jgi:hypothetical protein
MTMRCAYSVSAVWWHFSPSSSNSIDLRVAEEEEPAVGAHSFRLGQALLATLRFSDALQAFERSTVQTKQLAGSCVAQLSDLISRCNAGVEKGSYSMAVEQYNYISVTPAKSQRILCRRHPAYNDRPCHTIRSKSNSNSALWLAADGRPRGHSIPYSGSCGNWP